MTSKGQDLAPDVWKSPHMTKSQSLEMKALIFWKCCMITLSD